MKCPYCQYHDTGWFSWKHTCDITGLEIPQVKVDAVCGNSTFFECPLYKQYKGL